MFWAVLGVDGSRLVTRMTDLAEAEPCCDFPTHPEGHSEVWDALQALAAAGLVRLGSPTAIVDHEYEDFPRCRVVFHQQERRFIACADRRLHGPATTPRIGVAFCLPEVTRPMADTHYRTIRTLPGDAA